MVDFNEESKTLSSKFIKFFPSKHIRTISTTIRLILAKFVLLDANFDPIDKLFTDKIKPKKNKIN